MLDQNLLANILLVATELSHVQGWMEQAFYPVLFILLVAASLGVPLPEDIPLIAAGVLMATTKDPGPQIANWYWLFAVAVVAIMTGDLILYMLGRRWGPGAVSHRYIRRLVTPERFARVVGLFNRWGTWFCFVGRFLMGIRAAMCVTAGATKFPYWRFFLADLAGALLSIPLFVFLGYFCAGMLGPLQKTLGEAKLAVGVGVAVAVVIAYLIYRKRKRARLARINARRADRLMAADVSAVPRPMVGRTPPPLQTGD